MPLPANEVTVLSLALSSDGAEVYAGTESQGLLHSDDGGRSWRLLLETKGAVNGIVAAADGRLLALVDNAVLRSDDGGSSWTRMLAGGVECMLMDAGRSQSNPGACGGRLAAARALNGGVNHTPDPRSESS